MEPVFAATTTAFIERLDAAISAHMDWTRHILRCAVLRTRPGDDVMRIDAHQLCAFGRWFDAERAAFVALDPQRSAEVERVHRAMHDAIRRICEAVDTTQGGAESDLDAFEAHQHALLRLLSELKTQVLTTAARRDPLTGLPMRYGIEQEFDLCRRDARRRGERLFAAMIDIDHFKRINDNHGHPTGDAVLQRVAAVLRAAARDDEPLYRFGGEEFLLLLRAPDVDAAHAALSRVLDAVRAARFEHGAANLAITATIGAAQVADDGDMASSIEAADAALYQGKREGRDRVWLRRR